MCDSDMCEQVHATRPFKADHLDGFVGANPLCKSAFMSHDCHAKERSKEIPLSCDGSRNA